MAEIYAIVPGNRVYPGPGRIYARPSWC